MNAKKYFFICFTFNQKTCSHSSTQHTARSLAYKMQKAKCNNKTPSNDACCTQNLKMDDLLVVVMMSLSRLL